MSQTANDKKPVPVQSGCKKRIALILFAGIVLFSLWPLLDWAIALPEGRKANYVGRQKCAECHKAEMDKWHGSDHDRAMDLATPEFVLGDFDGTQLEHHGVTSKMSRRGDKFFVETEDPDGEMAEFEVKWVFGYQPLQQYLTELERGQIQVLPVTWDTEKEEWFFANPDEPFGVKDPLHWTGSMANWNHMCADCHVTNFDKGYNLKNDSFHSTWSEGDVSCEACHGAGSIHVELAESKSLFWDRRYGYGLAKLKGGKSTGQLESCAPCHARRQHIYPSYHAGEQFYDHFNLSLLHPPLYHHDGQIDDEVYVYGSFQQSLMYRKGVGCTDCHDPHTTRVKYKDNRLCTQCHMPARYDAFVHHRHKEGSEGASCVECHMPEKTYMVVDPRRDHSLRIPRPDLTMKIGSPNACNKCHNKPEETPQWAADKIVEWYGPKRRNDPHYGETLFAARHGAPQARKPLEDLTQSTDVGPIVRATAVSLLTQQYPDGEVSRTMTRALRSPDSLVRAAAVQGLEGLNILNPQSPYSETDKNRVQYLKEFLMPRINDPQRLVRVQAARVATTYPRDIYTDEEWRQVSKVVQEYREGLMITADQFGTHMALGRLDENLGDRLSAIRSYRNAMRLEPAVTGPRSHLAELLSDSDPEEARVLRKKELELLQRDAKLLPQNAGIQYRLGMLNYILGNKEQAGECLINAAGLEPDVPMFQEGLVSWFELKRDWAKAIPAAKRLVNMRPENIRYRQLLHNIQTAAAAELRPIGPQR